MAAPALGWNRPLENSGDQAAGLPPEVAQVLEPAMLINYYPSGSLLFMEGQPARGIFLLLQGRVKLMVSAPTGKTLILKMAEEGDALGMASVVCSQPYEATAQIQGSAELGFVRASDLRRLMRCSGEVAFWVTQQLSRDYSSTCHEIRSLILSDSASEKLARLMLGWIDPSLKRDQPVEIRMPMTHEEIGQMIGTSRETVTRLFAGFKKRRLISLKGSQLTIPNRIALESMISA